MIPILIVLVIVLVIVPYFILEHFLGGSETEPDTDPKPITTTIARSTTDSSMQQTLEQSLRDETREVQGKLSQIVSELGCDENPEGCDCDAGFGPQYGVCAVDPECNKKCPEGYLCETSTAFKKTDKGCCKKCTVNKQEIQCPQKGEIQQKNFGWGQTMTWQPEVGWGDCPNQATEADATGWEVVQRGEARACCRR